MRYTNTIEVCNCCGKRFSGMVINNHGSYDYIHHTNFSNNIRVLLARTEELDDNKRVNGIVKEFFSFTDSNNRVNKQDAIEFLECFKHYNYSDKELLQEVFDKIQMKINTMK